MTDTYNINHIVSCIKSIRADTNPKKGICVFLGAGADLTSGGKLFRDLKKSFLEYEGEPILESITDQQLDALFEERIERLSQDGRCEALESIMRDNREPSEGYQLLVLLARAGIINNIITTNFDVLLEESEKMLGIEPFRIYAPGLAVPEEEYLHRSPSKPAYIKLHGDLNSRIVTHITDSEIKGLEYADSFLKYVRFILRTNHIIFVGYSGFDSLITKIAAEEINNMDACFWCNPSQPKEDSGLANLLKNNNKLQFVETKFDTLFTQLSERLFADEDLPNANYIFFDPIIKSKSDKLISEYMSGYDDKRIVKRKSNSDKIKAFLADTNSKFLLISGESGSGKTCLLQKSVFTLQSDITWVPIKSSYVSSITCKISSALGYGMSETAFSLLYSFSSWCNARKKLVVFIIDGIFNDKFDPKLNLEQCNEFMALIRATSNYACVKYIVTFSDNVYDSFISSFVDDNLDGVYLFNDTVTHFNEDELSEIIKLNGGDINSLSNDIKDILKEPYMWHIVNENNISVDSIDQEAFFDALIDNISEDLNSYTLKAFLKNTAYSQVFDTKNPDIKRDKVLDILLSAKIVDENAQINNQLILRYFCGGYIYDECENTETVITKYLIPLSKNSDIQNVKTCVLIDLMSCVQSEKDIENRIMCLENAMKGNSSEIEFLQHFTVQVFERILHMSENLFGRYIYQANLSLLSEDILKCLIKTISQLKPEWCDAFLNNKNHIISFEAFITLNDFIFKNGDHGFCFSDKELFLISLYQLSYWGWDNTPTEQYSLLCDNWKKLVLKIKMLDDEKLSGAIETIKKSAYNIFFDSGSDVDEKYHAVYCNPTIAQLKENLLCKGKTLSLDDINKLINSDDIFFNSYYFIIANLLVIYSTRLDFDKTYSAICESYETGKYDVEKIDFILSCMFWAMYICRPNDRAEFVSFFRDVLTEYETIIFNFPTHKRQATVKRFSEQFEYEFEDGFNPLAFYFYTAPYECPLYDPSGWDNGKNALSIYWDLLSELKESGNYGNMLRLVHALGQMISIYPQNGLSALSNIKPYLSEPIIKKGVIRILKESYIRNNRETDAWLNNCNELNDSIYDIKYNTQLYVNNRTFEQLHWSRMFYNIEIIYNIQLDKVILSSTEAPSFNNFLERILKHIIHAMERAKC